MTVWLNQSPKPAPVSVVCVCFEFFVGGSHRWRVLAHGS